MKVVRVSRCQGGWIENSPSVWFKLSASIGTADPGLIRGLGKEGGWRDESRFELFRWAFDVTIMQCNDTTRQIHLN